MLAITPSVLDFGCVAQGFVYSLDVAVTNNDSRSQRIKVACARIKGPDQNRVSSSTIHHSFAPGMSTIVTIELRAETASSTSQYDVIITAEHNNLEVRATVTSIVIPMDIFKYFAKSLHLQKRPVMKQGVQVVGVTAGVNGVNGPTSASSANLDDKSFYSFAGTAVTNATNATNTTTGRSVFTEALMDDQDIEELLDIPMTHNMYWDPKGNSLRVDKEASKVIVDGKLTLEECERQTTDLRNKRYLELEAQGYYPLSAIERIRGQVFSNSIDLLMEEDEDEEEVDQF